MTLLPVNRSLSAALYIVIVALALGFAIVIPPFQSNDEHGHFVRVYEISRGNLLGQSVPTLPQPVLELIRRYPERLEDEGGAGRLFREEAAREQGPAVEMPIAEMGVNHRYLAWGIIGANLYCPVAYLPAVAGVWLGRSISVTPLGLVYAARISNVILFAITVAVAFRLAPQSRAFLGAIALMPMTLQQASVVSADATVISASFLGFASVLRSRERPVSRRLLVFLAIFFPVWVICKPSPWTFAVTLLIGGVCFASWRSRFLYVAALWAGMIVTGLGWQLLSASNSEALRESRLKNGIDVKTNVTYALHDPAEFGLTVASAMVKGLPDHSRQFWGVFGWSKFSGPWWLRSSYLLLLLFVAASERLKTPITTVERLLAAGVFVCGFVFVYVAIFLSDAHPCNFRSEVRLCFDNSAGVQGRYFIPFGLFGLLALKQERFQAPQRSLMLAVVCAGMVQGGYALALIARRFYA